MLAHAAGSDPEHAQRDSAKGENFLSISVGTRLLIDATLYGLGNEGEERTYPGIYSSLRRLSTTSSLRATNHANHTDNACSNGG